MELVSVDSEAANKALGKYIRSNSKYLNFDINSTT